MPTPNSNEQSELFNEGLPAATGATSTTQASEEDVLVIEETALVTDVIRSEVNFLVLPFFALWDKDVERRTKTEYKAVIKRGKQKLEVSWTVLAQPEFGYPGPFDKKVHKAIEEIISELPHPIKNPIPLGSFHNLYKRMGFNKMGGSQYKKIKESFERITTASIKSEGAFYNKGKEEWIEDVFHLYDRVVLKGKKLSSGEIADTNYLYLNSWYLDNINSNYMKPIDWNYYISLETPIAQRLYELLSVKFYGVVKRRGRVLVYRYSTLCDLLPATRQKYLSKAKTILDPAHEKLKETGFLADYQWDDTSPKSKRDWLIIYYPGMRAREEIKFAETYFKSPGPEVEYLLEPELEEEPAKTKQIQAKVESRKSGKVGEEVTPSPIAQELINCGITKAVAIDLAESFSEEYLAEKIELHNYKKETGELTTNAAGWLREAIVHDYQLSEEQLKRKAQVEKRKAQQEEQKTLEEKAKQIQEQRLKEALANFPEAEQWVEERVVEHVKVREMTIEAFGGEQFTEEEISEMYLRYQTQAPKTDEEKRVWLISHDSEYALSSIIEEIRKEQQSQQEESKGTDKERFPPYQRGLGLFNLYRRCVS